MASRGRLRLPEAGGGGREFSLGISGHGRFRNGLQVLGSHARHLTPSTRLGDSPLSRALGAAVISEQNQGETA